MNLIIDQGNTLFKVALFNDNKLVKCNKFKYSEEIEFINWVKENYDFKINVIIGSVVNTKLDLSQLHIKNIIYLNNKTKTPIKNKYKTPKTLGLDRLSNAVAAWSIKPNSNSLIIDMGTCIKYDLVNNKGEYIGGNISLGLNMRYKALEYYTDQLPLIKKQPLNVNYGTDTESSILCGVQLAIINEINGFISLYKSKFSDLTIFMTGGDTKHFEKYFKNAIFANSKLTLIGLNEILKYNA